VGVFFLAFEVKDLLKLLQLFANRWRRHLEALGEGLLRPGSLVEEGLHELDDGDGTAALTHGGDVNRNAGALQVI